MNESPPAATVRVAIVTAQHDWSHRSRTSGANFDMHVARDYVASNVEHMLELMNKGADLGATIILGPEYFTGCEMFTTTRENQFELTETTTGSTAQKLCALSKARGVHLAAAYNMRHGDTIAQTGIVTTPEGTTLGIQVKNTSVAENHPLAAGYQLMQTPLAKLAMFTCSDCTTYPEDPIALAKQGMELMLLPGCGFAGPNWMHFLKVRSIDLNCPIVYTDGSRGAILDRKGTVLIETHVGMNVVVADVPVVKRQPVARLRAGL